MVPVRSLLFVPGDSERKIEKSSSAGADAIVYDLEDSVTLSRKQAARENLSSHIGSVDRSGRTRHWIRINPISTPEALPDLAALVRCRPDGIVLPKAESPEDVRLLGRYLDALEVREGVALGSIPIVPVAAETARSSMSLYQYPDATLPRLYGLTWGAEDLSASLGAAANTDEGGGLSLTYRMARSLMLLAAKGAEIAAIETVYPDFRDLEGLRLSSLAARREGFDGRFAIHPDQVPVINAAFAPTATDIEFAEQVVAAFAASPDLGVVAIDGKMFDMPHLVQARKVLALRDALAGQ